MVLKAYIKEFTIEQKTSTLNYTRKEVGLEAEGDIYPWRPQSQTEC